MPRKDEPPYAFGESPLTPFERFFIRCAMWSFIIDGIGWLIELFR